MEADKVFLVKQLHLIGRLKALSYFYSLFFQTMVLAAGFLCLLPFLLHYYLLNWSEILVLFVYFTALQSCFMLWKYHIRKIGSIWAKSLLVVFLFLVLNWFSQWIYHIVDMGMTIPVYALSLIILLLSIFFSLTALRKIASIDSILN